MWREIGLQILVVFLYRITRCEQKNNDENEVCFIQFEEFFHKNHFAGKTQIYLILLGKKIWHRIGSTGVSIIPDVVFLISDFKSKKMKYLNLSFLAIAFIFLTSCATVQSDYDRDVDFGQYNTYNYFTNIEWGNFSELDQRRFYNAIDAQMQAKGFTKSENPQLIIDIQPKEREYKSTDSSVRIGGGNWGRGVSIGGSVGIPIRSKKSDKQIIVEMVDASNNQMVWQGVFDKTTSPNANKEKLINNVVEKIMAKFPPKK